MNAETRNYLLAVVLSILVVVGWQFLVAGPQVERNRTQVEQSEAGADVSAGLPLPERAGKNPPTASATGIDIVGARADIIAKSRRIAVDTESLIGSINLTGGRLDDLQLRKYRETSDPDSPVITLFSPQGTDKSYFSEQGWVNPTGSNAVLPDSNTEWTVEGNNVLTVARPVTLVWDNGSGLLFRRNFAVDENYLFTVTQTVENATGGNVSLYPYSYITRQGIPPTSGFFIMHEGPIGVVGGGNQVKHGYKNLIDDGRQDYTSGGGWLGFTDKYWAAVVFPEPGTSVNTRYMHNRLNNRDTFQTSYVVSDPVNVGDGNAARHKSYVFAGAKVEAIIDSYETGLGVDRLELLIDWGWFHFITKPLFKLIRALHSVLGNFGLAILAVTVMIKIAFFWFSNKSYASMAAMKKVQPEMKQIQERFADDRMAQQQAMMELYKREKVNPMSGCWPVLIQIPVFFSLYSVLLVTIEMRQAPFYGWIQDLAQPDPTNLFNLFGLLPYDPTAIPAIGGFLALGVWPLIMGISMFVQMRLNPPPTDATQAAVFAWMPVIFTFMLAGFPAGLVIYWAWNNFLSIVQQYYIMRRHGAEVNLLGNILATFRKKQSADNEA